MKYALHSLRLFLLLALLLPLALVESAKGQENDSTWDDLGLDPNGFQYGEELFGHISIGWFPQPYPGSALLFGSPMGTLWTPLANVYDFASDVRPRGFHPTTAPFSWHNPYVRSERDILKPNDDEEEDDGPLESAYDDYTLTYLFNLPFPAIIRLNGGLQISEGILFSNDTTRNYLLLNGAREQLKEVGVFYLKQYSLAGSAGVNIPFYGAFIKNELMTASSYYYLFGGYGVSYAVWSRGTQYSQIANAKDQIRYGNGTDTTTLIDKKRIDGVNRLRRSIELGLGWNVMAEKLAAFNFEAFVSIPESSVVDDAEWKQYFIGLRIAIGWHWVP